MAILYPNGSPSLSFTGAEHDNHNPQQPTLSPRLVLVNRAPMDV